jgi:hypothetical protein
MDAVMIKGRILELSDTLATLESTQKRRGRPRAATVALVNPPSLQSQNPWGHSGHVINDPDPKDAAE